jgi:L-asparaginase
MRKAERMSPHSARSESRVVVIATGGTIGNTADGRISVESVLDDVRQRAMTLGPAKWPEVEVLEVMRVGSASIHTDDWQRIAAAVGDAARRDDVAGVVVTHGSYTAEETAYYLHLVLDTSKPVVVACSQRVHGSIGNDGDRNLLDAIRIATDPNAGGLGVLVTLNEEIHSAREVIKSNQRPGGFSSGRYGLLGSVEADAVTFYRSPTRRHTHRSALGPVDPLPRVDIVATYVGADGAAVDGLVAAGARGLVVNGFAFNGMPYPLQRPSLEHAASDGVAVVLVSRGGGGRVPATADRLFVGGDDLSAQKARILLALALAHGEGSDLRRIFAEY